ncbi:helix-turn-helix domain-containing protein [Paenibacillus mendelii]|uniref:Helix-turn-helix domain-containing protein n=1 Tax=Paenibacillus mendelii TaxID=206163 RepID=A0ABV6J8N8_9BACL|nr:AraC family transcriptional regulator [Paenibacillus mendelii]MCQ6559486.1 AraC family transcriptional regulator [Paenibacillus mendelii]
MNRRILSNPDVGGTLLIHDCHYASVEAEWFYHKHHHTSFELLHCLDGTAVEWINGQAVTLSTGDWLFLGSGVLHSTITGPNAPFSYFTVHFDMDDMTIREELSQRDYILIDSTQSSLAGPLWEELENLLVDWLEPTDVPAKEETVVLDRLTAVRRLSIQSVILRMIVELLGVMEKTKPQLRKQAATSIEIELAHEIEKRLHAAVFTSDTIGAIARQLYMNRNRCNLVFKKVYGMPPHHYLNLLKMRKAKELILRTTASLEEIGVRLGFSCASSFSRQFRRWTGYAPIQLRKSKQDHVSQNHERTPIEEAKE